MKSLFHHPPGQAYFDCANSGLISVSAADASIRAVRRHNDPGSNPSLLDLTEAARAAFATMVGASANDIALIPSASYGMMLAGSILDRRHGKSVVTLADEHPSHILPLRALCHAQGLSSIEIERHPGQDPTPDICAAISADSAAVCIPPCSWLDGTPIDLQAVGAAARANGALLFVDATQAAGVMPIDVAELRPDLLVGSAYKWLLSPIGVGFAYVNPRHQDLPPPEDGWTHREAPDGGWFDAAGKLVRDPPWREGARRFDAAGSANPLLLEPTLAALEWISGIGTNRIQQRLSMRNAEIMGRHPDLDFRTVESCTHILSCQLTDAEQARKLLAEHRVIASIRGTLLRLSGHLWNDDEDLERLDSLLTALIAYGFAAAGR